MALPSKEEMWLNKKHCPVCKDELKGYYSMEETICLLMGFFNSSYCPNCDILKEHDYQYCADCNSAYYYSTNRKVDRIIMYEIDDIEFDIKYFWEKDAGDCDIKKLEGQKENLEKRLPDHVCWYCGGNDFSLSKEDADKLSEIGEAKIGYRISKDPIITIKLHTHDCKPSDVINRFKDDIYKAECEICKEDKYIQITDLDKTELQKILGIDMKIMPDEIDTVLFWEANRSAVKRLLDFDRNLNLAN